MVVVRDVLVREGAAFEGTPTVQDQMESSKSSPYFLTETFILLRSQLLYPYGT